MVLFHTKSEKKSLAITSVITVILALLLLFFGLTSMYPPVENGIAINFGNSAVGMGETQPSKPVKMAPTVKTTPQEPQPQKEVSPQKQNKDILTQNTEDAPVIPPKKKKEKTKEHKVIPPKKETVKKEVQKKPVEKPKPSKSTTDALNNILNGKKQQGSSAKGEGNDQLAGDKGDPSGDRNATSYYGQGKGLSGSGNYRLSGRKALVKKKYVQKCNEEGTVVVEIKVNRQGNVVRAIPGVKGSTNTSSCLLEPAKRAALDTKFNADPNAPAIQTGYIIYVFKLSD